MTETKDIQSPFLEKLLGNLVHVYLASGIHLVGTLTGFDNHVITLGGEHGPQMIYKTVISTVSPA